MSEADGGADGAGPGPLAVYVADRPKRGLTLGTFTAEPGRAWIESEHTNLLLVTPETHYAVRTTTSFGTIGVDILPREYQEARYLYTGSRSPVAIAIRAAITWVAAALLIVGFIVGAVARRSVGLADNPITWIVVGLGLVASVFALWGYRRLMGRLSGACSADELEAALDYAGLRGDLAEYDPAQARRQRRAWRREPILLFAFGYPLLALTAWGFASGILGFTIEHVRGGAVARTVVLPVLLSGAVIVLVAYRPFLRALYAIRRWRDRWELSLIRDQHDPREYARARRKLYGDLNTYGRRWTLPQLGAGSGNPWWLWAVGVLVILGWVAFFLTQ